MKKQIREESGEGEKMLNFRSAEFYLFWGYSSTELRYLDIWILNLRERTKFFVYLFIINCPQSSV